MTANHSYTAESFSKPRRRRSGFLYSLNILSGPHRMFANARNGFFQPLNCRLFKIISDCDLRGGVMASTDPPPSSVSFTDRFLGRHGIGMQPFILLGDRTYVSIGCRRRKRIAQTYLGLLSRYNIIYNNIKKKCFRLQSRSIPFFLKPLTSGHRRHL